MILLKGCFCALHVHTNLSTLVIKHKVNFPFQLTFKSNAYMKIYKNSKVNFPLTLQYNLNVIKALLSKTEVPR